MDFYRSLITDRQKRISLKQNDLVEFVFNTSVHSLQYSTDFFSALAQVELDDILVNNIRQGLIEACGRALTVRVHRIQRRQHFDKFLILVKQQGDCFDYENEFVIEGEFSE